MTGKERADESKGVFSIVNRITAMDVEEAFGAREIDPSCDLCGRLAFERAEGGSEIRGRPSVFRRRGIHDAIGMRGKVSRFRIPGRRNCCEKEMEIVL